jgi:hypothetical protein
LAIRKDQTLASYKNSIRLVLAMLFAGIAVLNAGLFYVAFGLSGDSRPERLDKLGVKIERGEDVPTGNLDSKNVQQVFDIFKRLAERNGQTVIVLTHEAHLGQQTHRRIRLIDGRIAEDS